MGVIFRWYILKPLTTEYQVEEKDGFGDEE